MMAMIPGALTRLFSRGDNARGGRLDTFVAPSGSPVGSRLLGAEQKASRVGPLIAYDNLGQPVWSPRDYGAFAREGFMQNAIVYRSVRMIAEAAASIPLILYEGGVEIEQHPLLELMRQPSHDHTGTDFLEAWYGFLLVAGNAYVEAVAVDGEIRELHNLRPDRMKVLPGLDGWPEGYEYTAGGKSLRFLDEPVVGVRPVLHTRLFHPANDHYGMSPIEAASVAIDIHNTASGWNKALLDNSARPSGALVYAASNGQMTDEQFARLKSELETNFQGAAHAGRPLLLEGGLDWKPLSLTPKDMDFIEAKNAAAREIALAIGVPPMLLGIPGDATYSNYAEAQRAFWRQTVLPLVNRMAQGFSRWLRPHFAPSDSASRSRPEGALLLRPDLDQVEALNPERDALWARLNAATFLTDDEKRAAAGYGAKGDLPASATKFNDYHDEAGRFTTADNAVPPSGGARNSDGRVQVAQGTRGRPSLSITFGAQTFEATPSQVQALSNARNLAESRIASVRELDPNWKPVPSLSGIRTAEEAIRETLATAAQAEARLAELARLGVGGNGGPPLGLSEPGTAGSLGSRTPRLPVPQSSGLPEFLMREPGRGALIGNLENLTRDERAFAEEMRDLGNDVEIVPRGAGRTPDFRFNGIEYELGTVRNIVKQDEEGLSAAISKDISEAKGQSGHVVIDARGQPGMTRDAADRAVRRAYGADSNRKIESITILTPEGPVHAPRIRKK